MLRTYHDYWIGNQIPQALEFPCPISVFVEDVDRHAVKIP